MENAGRSLPGKTLWAYAYEIVPPQAEAQLSDVRTLLENEHAEAKRTGHTWTGKVVHEPLVTHILVVSDSPDQRRDINRRLEARLKQKKAVFSLTLPMAVTDGDGEVPSAGGGDGM